MYDLEERLKRYDTPGAKFALISQLRERTIMPPEKFEKPKRKPELIEGIVEKMAGYSPFSERFGARLDDVFVKRELERMYFGLSSIRDPRKGLKKLVSKLDDWEKACFFIGIWSSHGESGLHKKSAPAILLNYIIEGYRMIKNKGDIFFSSDRRKKRRKHKGPRDYLKNTPMARIERRFRQLLKSDDGSWEKQSMICMFVDTCSPQERKYLMNALGKGLVDYYSPD